MEKSEIFKEIFEELKGLIGKKVSKVEFYEGYFDSGFFIVFDDGQILTAQDGEYLFNAFSFVDKDTYEKSKKYS